MEKEQTNENSWEFHLTDKIAQLSKMTLEMHTEFWLSTLQTWFHGYQTPEEYKATIWGREVDLCISIAPLETPTEKLPIIEEKSAKGKNELLPPEQDCTKIWSNPDLPVEEKISQLIPYKIELYDLVRNVQLPDDLMRADTNISITMATIQFFAQSVEKNAKKNKIKTPKQVRQLVKFTNDIITRMDEGQNKLNGVERDMTKEESKAYDAYLDIKIGARSALHSFEKRLELYERLWEMPSVSIGTKIECLNETIKLIRKQCGKNLEPRCPHESLIRKHLKAISGYMNRLEEEGEAIWQLRMADELLPTANAWREDCELPALSREEFALQVELQSVHIETKEKENGSIHYELELFFQDTEDTFAGHFLYADIEDHEVKEITLMG